MSENQFTDRKDIVGFFQIQPDPFTFLTLDSVETEVATQVQGGEATGFML